MLESLKVRENRSKMMSKSLYPCGGPLCGDGGAEDAVALGAHARGRVPGDKTDSEGEDGDGVADDHGPPS